MVCLLSSSSIDAIHRSACIGLDWFIVTLLKVIFLLKGSLEYE